jgi:predicted unusual protein kinase regulating ubiquinone biosynthesis (AarF/ABC1/UbiB family)
LPIAVCKELARLCDAVPPFPREFAVEVLKEELGEHQLMLPKEPAACASLGQVYCCRIADEEVAVKVQRPGMREALAVDVFLLRSFAMWSTPFVRRRSVSLNPVKIIDSWAATLWQELDYEHEARTQMEFHARLVPRVRGLVVPKVIWKYCTRRVLTTEWIHGTKVGKSLPRPLIQVGVQAYAAMVLELGVVHADPHTGNLLVTAKQGLCLLDYGMVVRVPPHHRKAWAECIVHICRGEYDATLEALIRIGFFPQNCDRARILPTMSRIWREMVAAGSSTEKRSAAVQDCLAEIMRLVRDFEFGLPDYYVALVRAFLTLEGIALQSDSDFDIFAVAFPVAARHLAAETARQVGAAAPAFSRAAFLCFALTTGVAIYQKMLTNGQ